ncbi:hypothetical protein D3C75_1210870 [compost metagenome]
MADRLTLFPFRIHYAMINAVTRPLQPRAHDTEMINQQLLVGCRQLAYSVDAQLTQLLSRFAADPEHIPAGLVP